MSEDKAMVVRALPEDVTALRTFAADAAASAFSAFKRPQDALLAVLTGRDLGLSAAQSVRAFHVIEGKPSLSADAMVAVCVARKDLCAFFRTVESTSEKCVVETQRVGEPGPRRLAFSMDDARRAGIAGRGPWKAYPAAMLRARAKSALARDTYPDLLLGIYDPDELDGYSPAAVSLVSAPAAEVPPLPEVAEAVVAPVVLEPPAVAEPIGTPLNVQGAVDAIEAVRAAAAAIKSARTDAELQATIPLCKAVSDESDRRSLREMYNARKRELHAKREREPGEEG